MPASMSRRRRFYLLPWAQLKTTIGRVNITLPDIVAIGLAQGKTIETVQVADAREMMGVNTREELAFMEKSLRER